MNKPTLCFPIHVGLAALLVVASASVLRANTPTNQLDLARPASLQIHYLDLDDAATEPELHLRGADARQQVLVTATLVDGRRRDYTGKVTFAAEPEGIVEVDALGRISPLQDGEAMVVARTADDGVGRLKVRVSEAMTTYPVNFPNQIVPIFTKAGCNGGGCHGKSGGQNGFRLSLLGFEPTEDYEYLVKETRGRRIFPASPERSLLLQKAVADVPHGGGKRIEKDSDDYKLLTRWIRQGMPYGNPEDPTVARIQVVPKQRVMSLGADQQLVVLAHYTDGHVEDVTRSALYEANEQEVAKADDMGRVQFFEQPGDVGVMVRYQGKVSVFRATIPLGAPVGELPAPHNFVDELVFKKLMTVGIPPSELSDDNTFLRRVTLDIAGRLPTTEETREFLEDKSPEKRNQWIDRLLAGPDYADHFANKWGALLRNKRNNDNERHGTFAFHGWIRDSLHENTPYDQFAREILAASGDIDQNPPVAWYRQVRDSKAQLEDAAQLFLGTRLQCAQCHHHPYERWSQDDYYSFSAVFSRLGRERGSRPSEEVVFHRRGKASATNPKTGQAVQAAGLGAEPFDLSPERDPREALVDWMSDSNNPFFSRSLVNRYWKHFFNRGLVEPEDDMRDTNPPTNPELLDALSRRFIESGYDLKDLVRTLTRSRTYQLSAVPNEFNAVDKQHYSRYYPKRLTAEVLLDSVDELTESPTRFNGLPLGFRAVQLPDNSYNKDSYFLTVFGRPDMASACECERSQDASLAQSLHLLNSKGIQDKLTADQSRPSRLAGDTETPDAEKIRELYAAAFSREPTSEEVKAAVDYLNRPPRTEKDKDGNEVSLDPVKARRQSYEDMVWALINTKEFLFNH